MANCKACGAWFSSTATDELCPTCERALKRLNGYAVPVVRCKVCKSYVNRECKNLVRHMTNPCSIYTLPNDFCSYGERREDEI